MGDKHGVWFDLVDHITIHKKVLDIFSWLIKSGDTEYDVQKILRGNKAVEISHDASFYTHNGFYVDIKKRTELSSETPPRFGMTVFFSYNCFKAIGNEKVLQYHSAHSSSYNPMAPWHNKPHRHFFDGNEQKVEIYSHDHRPLSEKLKKYTWAKGSVELQFLNHENWPYIKEFLDEVSSLK